MCPLVPSEQLAGPCPANYKHGHVLGVWPIIISPTPLGAEVVVSYSASFLQHWQAQNKLSGCTPEAAHYSIKASFHKLNKHHIVVKCGSVDGKLYFNLLRDCTGNIGSVKCILTNSHCTPNKFEQKGGKAKLKNWKKSVQHGGKSLLTVLPTLGLDKPRNIAHAQDWFRSQSCKSCFGLERRFWSLLSSLLFLKSSLWPS